MTYLVFEWLHVLGVILLVGNVSVTAVWKVFADRSDDARVVAFGQRLVTLTDLTFTLAGITLILVGGFGAAAAGRMSPFAVS